MGEEGKEKISKSQSDTSKKQKLIFGLTPYQLFVAVVAWAGWTLVAMDLNIFSTTLPEILTSFKLSPSLAGFITSAVFAGMAVLQFLLAPLIEYLGRKLMFNLTLLGTALFTGLTIFASSVPALIGVRIAADGFSYTEFPTGVTLVNETVPGPKRGSVYGWVQSGFPSGFALASLATYFILPHYGWRAVYLVGIAPAIVVLIARLWVKEPERYKEYKKLKSLRKSGKEDEVKKEFETTQYKTDPDKAVHFTYKQLFSSDLRKQNIVLSVAEFLHEFATPTYFFFTAVILEDYRLLSASQALIIILVGTIIAAFAYGIAGMISNRIQHGRKWTASASTILGGIASIAFILAKGYFDSFLSYVLYAPIVLSWNGSIWVYIAESNPTRARGTAEGYINGVSTIAWILGSFLYTIGLDTIGLTWWWIVGGVIPTVLAGIVLLLFGRTIPPKSELEEIVI